MPRKILRRCTICKKFGATYLAQDPVFGKCHLCHACWEVSQAKVTTTKNQKTMNPGR